MVLCGLPYDDIMIEFIIGLPSEMLLISAIW